jgi:hypothetical protein
MASSDVFRDAPMIARQGFKRKGGEAVPHAAFVKKGAA